MTILYLPSLSLHTLDETHNLPPPVSNWSRTTRNIVAELCSIPAIEDDVMSHCHTDPARVARVAQYYARRAEKNPT